MIPEEYKKDIIGAGINFMRSITVAYGTDVGMKLFDTIADSIDSDIKSQIFIALLTGEYNGQISISGRMPNSDKIQLIKAIRTYDKRDFGLKEAKEMVESLDDGKTITLQVFTHRSDEALRTLREIGCYV